MTTYPDGDPRLLDPDAVVEPVEAVHDPDASHPKRDIIDPDYQPVPDDERGVDVSDDERGFGEKLADALENLTGRTPEGWSRLTDDEAVDADQRREQAEEEARLEQRAHE